MRAKLLLVSLLCVLCSCSPKLVPGPVPGVDWRGLLAKSGGTQQFRMQFARDSFQLDGLLVLKPLGGDTCRIVALTQMGPKLFDVELSPRHATWSTVLPPFDKRLVAAFLAGALRFTIYNDTNAAPSGLLPTSTRDSVIVLRGGTLYTLAAGRVVHKQTRNGKQTVDFAQWSGDLPAQVRFAYRPRNIRLQLDRQP